MPLLFKPVNARFIKVFTVGCFLGIMASSWPAKAQDQSTEVRQLKAIVAALFAEVKSLRRCDGRLSADGRTCYKHFASALSSPNAELSCAAWGGRLASIHSKQEMDLVASLLPSGTSAWIGAIRNATGFEWSDGTAWDWSNWRFGEPNNSGGSENCGLTGFHESASWGDFHCDTKTAFVCKKAQ